VFVLHAYDIVSSCDNKEYANKCQFYVKMQQDSLAKRLFRHYLSFIGNGRPIIAKRRICITLKRTGSPTLARVGSKVYCSSQHTVGHFGGGLHSDLLRNKTAQKNTQTK